MVEIDKKIFTEAVKWIYLDLDDSLRIHAYEKLYPTTVGRKKPKGKILINELTKVAAISKYLNESFSFPEKWTIDNEIDFSEEEIVANLNKLDLKPNERGYGFLLANFPEQVIDIYNEHRDSFKPTTSQTMSPPIASTNPKNEKYITKLKNEIEQLRAEKAEWSSKEIKSLKTIKRKNEETIERNQIQIRDLNSQLIVLKRELEVSSRLQSELTKSKALLEQELTLIKEEVKDYKNSNERQFVYLMRQYDSGILRAKTKSVIMGTLETDEVPANFKKVNPVLINSYSFNTFIKYVENFTYIYVLTWQFPMNLYYEFESQLQARTIFISDFKELERQSVFE